MSNKVTERQEIILNAINKLKDEFERDSSKFKDEKDLHYRFHDILIDNIPNYSSSMYNIRWEANTALKYEKEIFNPTEQLNKLLKDYGGRRAKEHKYKELLKNTKENSGKKGEIDITVKCEDCLPKLYVAIEFSLDTNYNAVRFFIHSYNDFLKLRDELDNKKGNYTYEGYLLRFADNSKSKITEEKLRCYAELLEYVYKLQIRKNSASLIKFDLIPFPKEYSRNVKVWLI